MKEILITAFMIATVFGIVFIVHWSVVPFHRNEKFHRIIMRSIPERRDLYEYCNAIQKKNSANADRRLKVYVIPFFAAAFLLWGIISWH